MVQGRMRLGIVRVAECPMWIVGIAAAGAGLMMCPRLPRMSLVIGSGIDGDVEKGGMVEHYLREFETQ